VSIALTRGGFSVRLQLDLFLQPIEESSGPQTLDIPAPS